MAVFDNTQQNLWFTFQWGGNSSRFVKVTARLYMSLWQGARQHAPAPTSKVQITYCQQAIPSPYRMPPYEHMEKLQVSRESLISSIVMLHELVATLPTIPAVVDIFGRRVSAYMDLVCIAYEIQRQRRFLSSEACNFLPFEDEPDHQSRRSILCNLLSSLRSKGGLYNTAYTFQSRAVTFICGNRLKNKVLCLPAATDDETTKAGTGAIDVITKMDTTNTTTVNDVPEHKRLAQLLWNKK